MTRVDSLNSAVRGIITLALAGGFVVGFFLGKISGEVFTNVVNVVITFWFLSREKQPAQPPTGGPTP